MMWMSQLAYETAHPNKIKTVLDRWTLSLKALADNPAAAEQRLLRGRVRTQRNHHCILRN
jgi:hypothetical protein